MSQAVARRRVDVAQIALRCVVMHAFSVLLLIASILACPYQCAVKLVDAAAPAVQKTCCNHCQSQRDHACPPGSDQDRPASDDDGVTCFCEGAMFDVASRYTLDDAITSTGELLSVQSLVAELSVHTRFRSAADDSPASNSGVRLRIVNQSFLL